MMAKGKDLKKENFRLVRECLYRGDTWSLSEIMEKTGLSHGSVINVLKELEQSQEIMLAEKTGNTVGRKTYRYRLNPEHMHLCAVSVRRKGGGFRYHLYDIDLSGKVCHEMTEETETKILDPLPAAIMKMVKTQPGTGQILVSLPGICRNGIVSNQGNYEFDLGGALRKLTDIPYVIENDVNVACIGFLQDHPGDRHLALIYQAEENIFGCGIIIHGKLYNGYSHAAGELRYVPRRSAAEQDAAEILKDQILSVSAVLNPEVIGYYSECTQENISLEGETIPENVRPELVRISDLEGMIFRGLLSIGLYNKVQYIGGTEK